MDDDGVCYRGGRAGPFFDHFIGKAALGFLHVIPQFCGTFFFRPCWFWIVAAAAAKRLTADSTSEQASAGLDALTDDEIAAFTELNAAYTGKHSFPFIIAVRDHTKAGILRAFERRLENDTDTEFLEACRQVERIAEIRLKDVL